MGARPVSRTGRDQARAALAQVLPQLLLTLDAEGVLLSCEGQGAGREEWEALVGRPLEDSTLPRSVCEALHGALRETLRTGRPQRHQYSVQLGGTVQTVEARFARASDEHAVCLLHDMGEHYCELSTMLSAFGDFYFRLNHDGIIVGFVAGAPTHVPPEHFLHKSASDVLPPPAGEVIDDGLARLRNGEDPVSVHYELEADGEVRHYEARLTASRDAVHATVRDVSETARIQQAATAAQKLESLGLLAGGIAHDFNNFLSVIVGNVELALLKVQEDGPAHAELVSIEAAATRASELTQQLTEYAGKAHARAHDLELNNLVDEMGQLLRTSVGKSAHLEMDLTGDAMHVRADASQIRQVLMNLIINASEAMAEQRGSIVVRTRAVEFTGAEAGQSMPAGRYVELSVADEGCGMDAEARERMFEPFFTTKKAGRGLGMSAVQGIVRSHKGDLRVRTAPGQGTTIKVLLPLHEAPRAQTAASPRPSTSTGTQFEGLALIVDDQQDVRDAGAHLLETLGFDVRSASNGDAALRTLESEPVSVVLLDLGMPDMDGRETLAELRRRGHTTPVVMMSGYREDAAAEPGTPFVAKPVSLGALRAVLADTLHGV